MRDATIAASTQATGSGGDIVIAAGETVVEDGSVEATGNAGAAGGGIAITGGRLEVRGGSGQVLTSHRLSTATQAGEGIDVQVTEEVVVAGGGLIATETVASNEGGDIRIEAPRIEVTGEDATAMRGSTVQAITTASGDGGSVALVADDILVAGGPTNERAGIVQAFVASTATGNGGDLTVETGRLEAREGAQLSTLSQGSGNAGSIDVKARDEVALTGETRVAGLTTPSGLFSRAEGNGNAGNVAVEAPTIRVEDGAEVSARALGSGLSGDVLLEAARLVRVSGAGEQVSVVTSRGIDGNGGDIDVRTGRLEVSNGGVMDVSTAGVGEGGTLTVRAGSVFVGGAGRGQPARLGAQADSTGNAGGIDIEASTVAIGRDGQVTALSRGIGGNPGDIRITAGNIAVQGEVTAESDNGAGGNVSLAAAGALAVDGGSISARSRGGGDAGTIRMSAGVLTTRNAQITTDSEAFGGNIEIFAGQLVNLENTLLSANSRGGANATGLAGGNIFIDPPAVIINNSTITANGFGNANGGNLTLVGNPLLISGDSLLSASSQFGAQGNRLSLVAESGDHRRTRRPARRLPRRVDTPGRELPRPRRHQR